MRYLSIFVLAMFGSVGGGLGCYEESPSGSGAAPGSESGSVASETIYTACVSDAQCDPSETCLEDGSVCTTACEEDRDCPEAPDQAQVCLLEMCVIGCRPDDGTCPEGQFCDDSGTTNFCSSL